MISSGHLRDFIALLSHIQSHVVEIVKNQVVHLPSPHCSPLAVCFGFQLFGCKGKHWGTAILHQLGQDEMITNN
jgi:uracil DNA glycosylase